MVSLGTGVVQDIQGRAPHYCHDWSCARKAGLRILAPATYIFLASLIPALAFGQQLASSTDGTLTVVHVLASTAIAGVVQAVAGGQPLLIIGVAEPIVIIYIFMYQFCLGRKELGANLFLPWAAWVAVWTAIEVALLAVFGACRLIDRFTRFSGEIFGMLIAVLFMQQAIKGLISGFHLPEPIHPGAPEVRQHPWRLVNGLWGLLLAAGLLLTAARTHEARGWRFFGRLGRALLADYGAALMVVVWSAGSFALQGAPEGVPRRVSTQNTWEVKETWYVTQHMAQVPGTLIAAALIPATIIAILFFFDHSVSAQLAQQPEYGLIKPPAYHYDLLLLGGLTLLCGLLGLPLVNGVLPQAPMHTRSLVTLKKHLKPDPSKGGSMPNTASADPPPDPRGLQAGALEAQRQPFPNISKPGAGAAAAGAGSSGHGAVIVASDTPQAAAGQHPYHRQSHLQDLQHLTPSLGHQVGAVCNGHDSASAHSAQYSTRSLNSVHEQSTGSPVSLCQPASPAHAAVGVPAADSKAADVPSMQVLEQRVTNLLQALAVGACLGATPAIQQIPEAVLWGFFAYMALESLPGNQFWERLSLLVTDPAKRQAALLQEHALYMEGVPFSAVAAFTIVQFMLLGGVWALVTWAGIGGVAFPIPIMALVPVRMYLLPRLFAASHLQALDALEYEQAPPLPPASTLHSVRALSSDLQSSPGAVPIPSELAMQPIVTSVHAAATPAHEHAAVAVPGEEERDAIEQAHAGMQVVHHLHRT